MPLGAEAKNTPYPDRETYLRMWLPGGPWPFFRPIALPGTGSRLASKLGQAGVMRKPKAGRTAGIAPRPQHATCRSTPPFHVSSLRWPSTTSLNSSDSPSNLVVLRGASFLGIIWTKDFILSANSYASREALEIAFPAKRSISSSSDETDEA
jgi:hypothetical protein